MKREALGFEPASVSLNPLPLLPTLELAKKQCELVEGAITTHSHQDLPTQLNFIHNWTNETEVSEAGSTQTPTIKRQNIMIPNSFIAHPLDTPFLSSDVSPSFSDLQSPSPVAESGISSLPMMHSLFDNNHNRMDTKRFKPSFNEAQLDAIPCTAPGCSRKFKKQEHFRRHMRTHQVTKPEKVKSMNERINLHSMPSSPFLESISAYSPTPMLSGLDTILASPFMANMSAHGSPFMSPMMNFNQLSLNSPQMMYGFTAENLAESGLMIQNAFGDNYGLGNHDSQFSIASALEEAAPNMSNDDSLINLGF